MRTIRAYSLIELVVVVAVITLLLAILVPALRSGRQEAVETKCTAGLVNVGRSLLTFASEERFLSPIVADADFYWDREPQLGWDIVVGSAQRLPGGRGSIWQCPARQRPYVGNSRALGLLRNPSQPDERRYRVRPVQWREPSRLVLAYDVQMNLVGIRFKQADEPMVGDLSDEWDGRWSRKSDAPTIYADFGPYGPHSEGAFGVLFADGHAGAGTYRGSSALIWSGARWW